MRGTHTQNNNRVLVSVAYWLASRPRIQGSWVRLLIGVYDFWTNLFSLVQRFYSQILRKMSTYVDKKRANSYSEIKWHRSKILEGRTCDVLHDESSTATLKPTKSWVFFGLKYNQGCDSSRGLLSWVIWKYMSISILVCLYSYRNIGNSDNNFLIRNHISMLVF